MKPHAFIARLRRAHVLGAGALSVLLFLSIFGLYTYFSLRSAPAYWNAQQRRITELPHEERNNISQSLRNQLLTQWSSGPSNPTSADDLIGHRATLLIPFEELNIWLSEEGIGLLSGVGVQLPMGVKAAMVDNAGPGQLRVTCDLINGKIRQVVSLTFEITINEDATVSSRLVNASAGRIALPTQTAIDLMAGLDSGNTLMLDMMQGKTVPPIDIPIDPSEDGLRDGRLVGLEVRDDAIVITRETVRRHRPE